MKLNASMFQLSLQWTSWKNGRSLLFSRQVPIFQINLLPPSSGYKWFPHSAHFSQTYRYHTTQNQILEHNTLGLSQH